MATMHMSATHQAPAAQDEVVHTSIARKALAALRIAFGLTFLWAFFDKLLALGYHTGWDATGQHLDRFGPAAWIHGGSPTEGFLKFGVNPDNWFHGAFTSIGGTVWADWLFMLGLLGIGVALTLGAGMRLAGITGFVLYVLMWAASFPLENNPVIDEHVLGAIGVAVLALTLAGDTWGLGRWWARTDVVRRYPILR
jgi:thiosulfate dehydrogenase [quinone] large subunit